MERFRQMYFRLKRLGVASHLFKGKFEYENPMGEKVMVVWKTQNLCTVGEKEMGLSEAEKTILSKCGRGVQLALI